MGRSPTWSEVSRWKENGPRRQRKREERVEREATYKEGRFGTSSNTAAVQEHLLHEDFAGVVHTQSNHGQRVANKNNINACLVGYVC